MSMNRLGNLGAIFLLGAVLAGCVTVPLNKNVDIQKAVKDRVAAGLEYLQMGKPTQARRNISRALQLDDDSAMAQNAMALLYKYEQDPKNEEKHYKLALRADRHFSPAHNNYGTLLYEQERYDEALDQFEEAANDPDYQERGAAFANMGRCYLAQGKDKKAKQVFLKAVRLASDNQSAQLALAQIYYREKNFRMSANYYNEYVSNVQTQSSEALWLGIRLAHHFGNQDQQASFELALKQLYQGSQEYQQWRQWKAQQEKDAASKTGGKG